uniref:Uncharacterized protein n=1 Tax=Pipistrellus kuhlii TaxID=59472 RepID=A0A7J7TJX5_PIPKU|nr:hypothetical protein mPipKuh1_009358 [Pipistrellus kuhlii]
MLIMKPVCPHWRPGNDSQVRAWSSSFFTIHCNNRAEPSPASFFRKEHVCNILHHTILPMARESPLPKEQSPPKCVRTLMRELKGMPTPLLLQFLRYYSKERSTALLLRKIGLSRSHHFHCGDNVALRACGP